MMSSFKKNSVFNVYSKEQLFSNDNSESLLSQFSAKDVDLRQR